MLKIIINTRTDCGVNSHTGLPVQGSHLLELIQYIYCRDQAIQFDITGTELADTHNPLGWISTILSFTLIPTSLIQPLTRSRSFASGQLVPWKVEANSCFIYALSKSESNLGRGEDASARGTGERIPDEVAMRK
jgi:hypothetical protein